MDTANSAPRTSQRGMALFSTEIPFREFFNSIQVFPIFLSSCSQFHNTWNEMDISGLGICLGLSLRLSPSQHFLGSRFRLSSSQGWAWSVLVRNTAQGLWAKSWAWAVSLSKVRNTTSELAAMRQWSELSFKRLTGTCLTDWLFFSLRPKVAEENSTERVSLPCASYNYINSIVGSGVIGTNKSITSHNRFN